jgi:hypothetical protein
MSCPQPRPAFDAAPPTTFDVRFFDYHWEELADLAVLNAGPTAASLILGAFLAGKSAPDASAAPEYRRYLNACSVTVEACCG